MKSVKLSSLWKLCASAALAVAFVACNKTNTTPDDPTPDPEPDPVPEVVPDPEPAEGIANQFQYNSADLIDIKSVIYADNEETETGELFLSPVEGLATVEEVLATDDYLYIRSAYVGLDGVVDTTKTFELSYKDLNVTDGNLTGKEHKVKITFSVPGVKSEWDYDVIDDVTVTVDYINDADEYLFARYTGPVQACYPLAELNNQYTVNEAAPVDLKSALCLYYEEYGIYYWFFYTEEGITEYDEYQDYALCISTPGKSESFDFADPDLGEEYGISAEGWGNAESGNVTLSAEAGKVTLSVRGVDDEDNTLRVEYAGAVKYSYYCDNSFYQPDYNSVALFSLFREKYGNASYYFAFGSNAYAETPAELMDGKYALFLEVPQSAVDAEYDPDSFTFPEGFKAYLYDYENYATYEWSVDDADDYSILVVKSEPNGADNKVYIRYDLIFKDAEGEEINIYMTAYLDVIDTTIPDLAPVKPFSPKITLVNEAGESIIDWDITEMQVRHQPAKSDIKDIGGSKMKVEAYSFYFVNANTAANGIDSDTATPVFSVDASKVNALDETQLNGTDIVWCSNFTRSLDELCQGSYGDLTNASKYGLYYCPEDVKVTIKKDDAKNWTFKLVLKDYGAFGSSFSGAPAKLTGTKNTLTIEWQGPATKYTGSKKNDLTDEDY